MSGSVLIGSEVFYGGLHTELTNLKIPNPDTFLKYRIVNLDLQFVGTKDCQVGW